MSEPATATFVGQLIVGAFQTPLTRLTIYPDRVVFRYRTEKTLPRADVEAVCPFLLPVIGWFTPSGVRLVHRHAGFDQRLLFKSFRARSILEAFEAAGYPVEA